MRFHELTVASFGPFAGLERVDFDALNDAGLFLLSGATGAGKTSILDAVCFALYGQVPGVRGVKALKSQHAPDDAHPEVVLDFSVRDRRFVVRRSPEWTRPKRRGEGLATERARATLSEVRADGEHLLSSRAAEVGHLVSDLVGMQAAQFQQVAMLPQGEFQRFLQASSQERHDVLQRLFHTDRFARIEDWVADHSKARREASSSGQALVQRLIDSLAERAGVEVPTALAPDTLEASAGAGLVLPWVSAQLSGATTLEQTARSTMATRREDADLARAVLDEATEVSSLLERRRRADSQLAVLQRDSPAAEGAATALADHRRAASCLSLLGVLDRARRDADRLTGEAERCAAAATERRLTPDPAAEDPWAAAVESLRERHRRADEIVPLLEEADLAQRQVVETQELLAAATEARTRAAGRHDDLPVRRGVLRATLDEATQLAGRSEMLSLQIAATRQRARAAADLPDAEETLTRLADDAREARDRVGDARDHLQDLVQRRLDGMAAELAGRLADGETCPVCGGTDHPSPAAPSSNAVTAVDQHDAGEILERAQNHLAELTDLRAAAERQVGSLRELAAARPAKDWQRDLEAAESALAESRAAAAQVSTLEPTLIALEGEIAEAGRTLRDHEVAVAELGEALRGLTDRAERAIEAVAAVWDGSEVAPTQLPGMLEAVAADLETALRAQETARVAAAALAGVDDLTRQAGDAAADHGFESLAALRRAVLPDTQRESLEADLAGRRRAEAAARAVLDDPAVRAVADRAAPDLGVLAVDVRAAAAEADQASRAYHRAEDRLAALEGLRARLEDALDTWRPAREAHVVAESISRLVRGMGGDNHLQMRLSAYVLATRLDQVLEAANERLSQLRDQRYLLQRTGRATRRGSQAGLGLEVVDQWTGDVRDPSTLSGGETFVVSLSLALGLADVVTHEAGGTEIETLFVDEGFGTLDADTLDDVMDRLDGLRAGGRTVGVVSHVTELRSRIPVQVHVDKSPAGSTIRSLDPDGARLVPVGPAG
ncbi:MAG: SMC family ATPase [Nocardioides sp.]